MGDIMGAFNQAVGLTKDPAAVAESSANKQLAATKDANAQAQANWEVQQQNQAPWLQAGQQAVGQLQTGTAAGGQFSTTPQFNFDPNSVNLLQDPGYKFRLQSGADATAAAGSAMGNLGSGNLGVALQNYGQQLGSQEYGAAYNRQYGAAMDQYNAAMNSQNTMFNRLSGIAGTGQVTANNLMSGSTNLYNQMGANTMNATQQAGALNTNAAYAQQNQLSSAGNQLGAIGNQLANYYTNQNALQTQQQSQWGGYSGTVDNYDPYTTYAGDSAGPWAG